MNCCEAKGFENLSCVVACANVVRRQGAQDSKKCLERVREGYMVLHRQGGESLRNTNCIRYNMYKAITVTAATATQLEEEIHSSFPSCQCVCVCL